MRAMLLLLAGSLTAGPALAAPPRPCEALDGLRLPGATITRAQTVAAGAFTPPVPPAPNAPPGPGYGDLPSFCRVAAELAPTPDSHVKIEVWLPGPRGVASTGWNGKLMGIGNGGWAGRISYGQMGRALVRGYATASTDTGHEGNSDDGSFVVGHPERAVDFGWRAVHEMTVAARGIVAGHYGRAPARAYWNGCSTGGRQALKEAQRFPGDYDGIIAGAPANHTTHLMAATISIAQATLAAPASFIPKGQYAVIHRAALAACDAGDGVADGVIDDPTRCRFDPGVLACQGAAGPDCLTPAQVAAARKIYAGPINPRTGKPVFPGLEPGSELGWEVKAGGPRPSGIADSYFKFLVFEDPRWDFRTLDLDRDVARADRLDPGAMNATDPDLKPFVARGGKLLLYHGWSDALIAPRNSVEYFNRVTSALGGPQRAQRAVRLFMAPGMNHCRDGDGPSAFDAIGALEQWVEGGKAPEQLIATRVSAGKIDRARPLCPYPQVAKYHGKGSTDDAASFTCARP
jgi:feruloyl esterase